jgi:hypothetical protein
MVGAAARHCRTDLFDCVRVELPEIRKLILGWMDRHLLAKDAVA